jgi:hypothetical protein
LGSFFFLLGLSAIFFIIFFGCYLCLDSRREKQGTLENYNSYSSYNYPYYHSYYFDNLFLMWYFYPIWYISFNSRYHPHHNCICILPVDCGDCGRIEPCNTNGCDLNCGSGNCFGGGGGGGKYLIKKR